MIWTDKHIDTLRKLWAEGLSASQIAGRIGGLSRNAVIGKIHRLGLSGRATTTRIKNHKPKLRHKSAARPRPVQALRDIFADMPVDPVIDEPDVPIPVDQRRTVLTLEEHHCRWPVGDPREAEFHFCGGQKVKGLAYCERHARRAFQPPASRRGAVASQRAVDAQLGSGQWVSKGKPAEGAHGAPERDLEEVS